MEELIGKVQELAITYLNESDDGDDEPMETFPLSIVDFVIEYAMGLCHFPLSFTEERKLSELSACKNALAMACVDIYLKIGTEGQESYSANGITRRYKSDWINTDLLDRLPNYVRSV